MGNTGTVFIIVTGFPELSGPFGCTVVLNQGIIMKTFILFLLALSALLVVAIFTTGRIPDAALSLASAFSASLAAWTLRQYDRKFHPLVRSRLLRPTLGNIRREPPASPRRLAA